VSAWKGTGPKYAEVNGFQLFSGIRNKLKPMRVNEMRRC